MLFEAGGLEQNSLNSWQIEQGHCHVTLAGSLKNIDIGCDLFWLLANVVGAHFYPDSLLNCLFNELRTSTSSSVELIQLVKDVLAAVQPLQFICISTWTVSLRI